jgi:thiamine pyrophosphate-dependent acetolactate synthase large subunit-like protein
MPKGSDLLVSALANEGVERIFGVVGIENLIRFDCVVESHNVSANGRADIPHL